MPQPLMENVANEKTAESQALPGRPRMNRQQTQQRDGEWFRLHLMGWEASEIASSYSVNRRSVQRAIERIRHMQSWADRSARQRHSDLISEIYDGTRLSLKESWRLYLQLKDKPEVAVRFLARVQSGFLVLARLVPDQESLAIEEKIAEVGEKQEQVRKLIEEQRLRSRVLPIQNGS